MTTSVLCCECHCAIIFPDGVEDRLRATHAGFFCLNGHEQFFRGPSAVEKERDELRTKLDAERGMRERAERARDAATREMRLSKNACKACHRRFETAEALTRHVRRIHQSGPKRLPEKAGESN